MICHISVEKDYKSYPPPPPPPDNLFPKTLVGGIFWILSDSNVSFNRRTNLAYQIKSNQIKKFYLKSVHFITIQHKLSRAFQTDMECIYFKLRKKKEKTE